MYSKTFIEKKMSPTEILTPISRMTGEHAECDINEDVMKR